MRKKLIAVVLVWLSLWCIDSVEDYRLHQWYVENQHNCNPDIPGARVTRVLDADLALYEVAYSVLLRNFPKIGAILWERPHFGERISVEEFDIWYYGNGGIKENTIIELGNSRNIASELLRESIEGGEE